MSDEQVDSTAMALAVRPDPHKVKIGKLRAAWWHGAVESLVCVAILGIPTVVFMLVYAWKVGPPFSDQFGYVVYLLETTSAALWFVAGLLSTVAFYFTARLLRFAFRLGWRSISG